MTEKFSCLHASVILRFLQPEILLQTIESCICDGVLVQLVSD
jgi:hypothetical protein